MVGYKENITNNILENSGKIIFINAGKDYTYFVLF
jgi:hypothetical protein